MWFVGKTGFFGMCGFEVKPQAGDKSAYCPGVSIPWLRERDEHLTSFPTRFVNRLMRGKTIEVWESGEDKDMKQQALEIR
jgi:hypothetical protein